MGNDFIGCLPGEAIASVAKWTRPVLSEDFPKEFSDRLKVDREQGRFV